MLGRLVACVVIGAATLAAADGKPNDVQKKKAGELVREAIAKSQAGDHEAAIELYNDAYNIAPSPLLLSNIGAEYQKAGKKIEAVKYFCRYLADDPNGNNADYAQAQVRALQIELKNPVDDKDACKAKPAPAATAVENPPATKPSEPPPSGPPAPPPTTTSLPQTAPPATDEGLHDHPGQTLRIAGLAVGAVGAIGFGVGVYFGLQAQSISDSITHHPVGQPWPTNINMQENEGKGDQNEQIAFMIGGGVALGAGVAMFLVGHAQGSAASEHVSIAPVATPRTLGAMVTARF